MALQPQSIGAAAFNDNDAGGNNYFAGKAIYIYKANGSYANIYSDSGGSNLIPQNGINNVTGDNGVFTFYIDGGEYYAQSDGERIGFWVTNSELIESYAIRAEDAALKASSDAKIFDTVALGVAGTVDGDYFSVVSPDVNGYLDLYKNNAGVAEFEKQYPSADKVTAIEDGLVGAIFDKDIVIGFDSNMDSTNNWLPAIGLPVQTFTGGRMDVEFTAGNAQAIKLNNTTLEVGAEYELTVNFGVISGVTSRLQIGANFSSSPTKSSAALIRPTVGRVYEISKKITASLDSLYIGVSAADNNGIKIAVHKFELKKTSKTTEEITDRIDSTSKAITGDPIAISDSLFKFPNNWEQGISDGALNYEAGAVTLECLNGESVNVQINDVLTVGQKYSVKFACKLNSGSASNLIVGDFASGGVGHATITPTSTMTEYEVEFTATQTYLSIGCLAADNNGQVVELQSVFVTELDSDGLTSRVDSVERELVDGNIIDDNSQNMVEPTNWVAQLGSPTLDYATLPGFLTVDLGSGVNKSVKIETPPLIIGRQYSVEIDLRVYSGSKSRITIGEFSTSSTSAGLFRVNPTTNLETYSAVITATTEYLAVGVTAADNLGTTITFNNVRVKDLTRRLSIIESELMNTTGGGAPTQTLATNSFMSSLSRYDKPLTKFCVAGDSLMANNVGGAIPAEFDEGAGYRPIRLDVNSVARRIYDHIAFNKAEHRRLDVVEWVKSGAWTTVNDSSVWEPMHPQTLYHATLEANAYVEITIPDGMENFALICQKQEGFGALNVSLNGGSISAHGESVIDLNRAKDNAADNGNPYYTVEYLGLPSGVNTIRVSKQNDSLECRVWGGFYWSGNTLIVHNIAHGGHTLKNLIDQHLNAEMLENDFDAILFEITIMNEMSQGRSPEQTVGDLKTIIDVYASGKDLMFMTPNPFGDNGSGTNYYANYQNPSMEDTSNACVKELFSLGVPYVNVFDMFKKKIENRGGTLLGGEGGLWYTTDGQHGNVAGVREWFNLVRPHLSNKPFSV